MAEAGKHRLTFKKARTSLFTHSYAGYLIGQYIKSNYKGSSKRRFAEISKLSKILNLDYKSLTKFILSDKTKRIDKRVRSDRKVEAFLEMEKELINLKTLREEGNSLTEEDYEYALLRPAIERAAGNSLKGIEDDTAFEQQHRQLQKKFNRWYYDTAYKYKLPTPRIIPFILRLIKPPDKSN